MGRREHRPYASEQLALATLEQCFVLAGIQQAVARILADECLSYSVYHTARDTVGELLAVPQYEDCRFTVYREVGRRTAIEFGGGIQVEFSHDTEFIGPQDFGVRVPVYARDGTHILPVESFTDDNAATVVRQVEQLALLRDTKSLDLSRDLTRIALGGVNDRFILEPVRAW
jgi:hypothetical protein